MVKAVETPKQLAERLSLPVTSIRYLIRADMLEHFFTTPGKRSPKIPSGAWEKYLNQFVVRPSEGEMKEGGFLSVKGVENGDN